MALDRPVTDDRPRCRVVVAPHQVSSSGCTVWTRTALLIDGTKMSTQQTGELCQRHVWPEVPELLTCWPLKTGTKMKQLVLLGPLKVDDSQECLQASTSVVSAHLDTYVFVALR